MTGYQKILIGLFLIIALGIRIHAALHDSTPLGGGDADGYHRIAVSLTRGEGFRLARYTEAEERGEPTAWCAPLYPFFLAGIYQVAGQDFRVVRMIQATLSTITVLVIALWALALFGGRSACFAALIASVYPAFYAYAFSSSSIGTETLYLFFFIPALSTFSSYGIRPITSLAVVSGLFWGLANLTRAMSLPLLLLLPFILILVRYPLRQVVRYGGVVWFVAGLVIAPWTIRNYLVFHTFVPISTTGGIGLYGQFHPANVDGFGGNVMRDFVLAEESRMMSLGMSQAERMDYYVKKGLGFIRADPGRALRLFVRRIFLYMDPRTTLYRGGKKQIITWGYLFVLGGALVGFFLSMKHKIRRREVLSLCLIFGYFIFLHALLSSSERYRFPNEPILIILAAFALDFLIKRWSNRDLENSGG